MTTTDTRDPEDLGWDDTRATSEGWHLSACDGYDHNRGRVQIQRSDDDNGDYLDIDEGAWDFVTDMAKLGSAYHQQALAILAELNPVEHKAVLAHTGYGPAPGVDPDFDSFCRVFGIILS